MSAGDSFIPFSRPSVTEAEIVGVERVVRSGWWTTGPEVRAFEEEFARYIGASCAVAVNSCTAGLHVALQACGIKPQAPVFLPAMTFAATSEVALYLDAAPVFLDSEPDTGNLDAFQFEAVIDALASDSRGGALRSDALCEGTRKMLRTANLDLPGAVMPVHFAGQACRMNLLEPAAASVGMSLIEDAAHAVETTFGDRKVGTFGAASAFSFYATKNLSTGEGGMVTTDDEDLAQRMRRLTLHGISRDAWKRYTAQGSWQYEVVEMGFKYNMTDIAAALGRAQLARVEAMATRRRQIAAIYDERLGRIEQVSLPTDLQMGRHAWHLYVIRLNLSQLTLDRAEFIERLRDLGIGASVHFIPLHRHPLYRDRFGLKPDDFPIAESIFQRSVSLPIYPDLSDEEVGRVCDAVERICTVGAA